jgi:GTP-binding protein HflX
MLEKSLFFERAEGGEKALLVHIESLNIHENEDASEFVLLCESAGLAILDVVNVLLKSPHPKAYLGEGKVDEIASLVAGFDAEVVLFNAALSPSQQRNLEAALHCRVIDRTGLILDIFAQRARTHEGKLQVELAQLHYVQTRLIRGWTHLERQKGGIGLRGPGETQLETDRRLIRGRIKSIERRLEKVKKQRQQGRRGRGRAGVPTVAVVGYTNAGKSTLFNQLTESNVYAADQLFATLDPTLRQIVLPGVGEVILADTVGFIRHLPHRLVDAFKATLEETVEADLLLHVVDAAAEERLDNIDQVNEVLKEIGADDKRQLMVYNKIDLLEGVVPQIIQSEEDSAASVWVSAKEKQGFPLLLEAIASRLAEKMWRGSVCLPASMGDLRARLYDRKAIVSESFDEQGQFVCQVAISIDELSRIERQLNVDWQSLVLDIEPFG